MFPKENRAMQEMLSEHIYGLSGRPLDKQRNEHLEIIQKLLMIYKDGFKHSYADFFPVILKIFKEDTTYNIDYLMSNLEIIRETLENDYSEGKNQFEEVYEQFIKLCDHLNLQISEMMFFSSSESKFNDASVKMQQANEDLREAQRNLAEANSVSKSLQTELIAVLSIFAAIVTTFSGGFTFLGSVMTSIREVEYYEIVVLAAIICGMVMFNTIFLMMYLVSKIIRRDIYAKCNVSDCSCDEMKCKCSGIKRVRKRLPYVFFFNVVCLLGIVIDCMVWFMDMKGII